MKQNNYNEMINGVINHNTVAENQLYKLIYNFTLRSVNKKLKQFSSSLISCDTDTNDIANEITDNLILALYDKNYASLKRFLKPNQDLHNYLSKTVSLAVLKAFTLKKKELEKRVSLTPDTIEQYEEGYTLFPSLPLDTKLKIVAKLAEQLPEKQRLVIDATLYNFENGYLAEKELAKSIGMEPGLFARNKNAAIKALSKLGVNFRNLCELDDLSSFAA